MSKLLIVGGDHLGGIVDKLTNIGFDEVLHISGRKCQTVKKGIPENVDSILVLTDYINHNLSKVIKQKAKEQSLPIYFAKRSWCSIHQAFAENQDTAAQYQMA